MSKGKLILVQGFEIFIRIFFSNCGLEDLLLVCLQPLHVCFPAQSRGCLLQPGKKAADGPTRCGNSPAETIQEPDGGGWLFVSFIMDLPLDP